MAPDRAELSSESGSVTTVAETVLGPARGGGVVGVWTQLAPLCPRFSACKMGLITVPPCGTAGMSECLQSAGNRVRHGGGDTG